MRGPSPLVYREEERHRALGRDAIFSWSRALTHPPRCNRTRHRDGHLVSDFVGSPSWISRHGGRHLGSEVVGAAISDLTSSGPPSWIGSDVKNAKVTPILLIQYDLSLLCSNDHSMSLFSWERSGSVVECLTRDRRAAGSSLTGVTALWSLSKTHLS